MTDPTLTPWVMWCPPVPGTSLSPNPLVTQRPPLSPGHPCPHAPGHLPGHPHQHPRAQPQPGGHAQQRPRGQRESPRVPKVPTWVGDSPGVSPVPKCPQMSLHGLGTVLPCVSPVPRYPHRGWGQSLPMSPCPQPVWGQSLSVPVPPSQGHQGQCPHGAIMVSLRCPQAVAEMLEQNRSLQSLNLESNFITSAGMMKVLGAIEKCPTLTELKVDNQVTMTGTGTEGTPGTPGVCDNDSDIVPCAVPAPWGHGGDGHGGHPGALSLPAPPGFHLHPPGPPGTRGRRPHPQQRAP